MGAFDDGLASHRRALALRQEAANADPKDVRAALSVASSTTRIGNLLEKKGDFPGALSELQDSARLYQDLANRPGIDWATVKDLAEVHSDIADALVDQAKSSRAPSPRAAGEYRKAREIYEGLRARGLLPKAYLKRISELQAEEDKLKPVAR